MPKTMPKPTPEQGKKVIAALTNGTLNAALQTAKATAKSLGLTQEEAAEAMIETVYAWADAKN